MKISSMNNVRSRIYRYLTTFHCFRKSTLHMLDFDNLVQLAEDYGFKMDKRRELK